MTNIVLCYPVEPSHLAQIEAAARDAASVAGWGEVALINAGQDGIASAILQADIFCGHAKVPVPWDEVVQRGRLRWIQSSAAGMDHCLVPSIIASDITVCSASGVLADQVAEHCIALTTSILRNFTTFFRQQQAREFIRRPTRDLHRSTIGIVGFGGSGRRIAQVFAPFKTRILATDYYPIDKPAYVEQLLPPEKLPEMLAQVDVLILSAPLNDRTRGMIDAAALATLRPGSILINVARGALVVEDALADALESGHLAAAATDVTAVEPLPTTSRLWSQPNMIITPHVAGQSARRIDDMTDFFCENLRRYAAGEPLRNLLIDKRLGFPPPNAARTDVV